MKTSALVLISCLAAVACAGSQPPRQLVQAREAYTQAEHSDAARYDPAALHVAQTALQQAERMYQDDGDDPAVSDAAYVATRRAERAQVQGETIALQHKNQAQQQRAQQAQAKAAQQAEQQLQATREQLTAAQAQTQSAEQRAREAMDKLRQSEGSSMSEQSRGTVITVAGALLFGSGKAALQPGASPVLDRVADALREQGDAKILIEGYTDSTGSQQKNLELSRQRAQTVADYLASRGVAKDKLQVEGRGPESPIAPNTTAEGRAQNRRVEITVPHPAAR